MPPLQELFAPLYNEAFDAPEDRDLCLMALHVLLLRRRDGDGAGAPDPQAQAPPAPDLGALRRTPGAHGAAVAHLAKQLGVPAATAEGALRRLYRTHDQFKGNAYQDLRRRIDAVHFNSAMLLALVALQWAMWVGWAVVATASGASGADPLARGVSGGA
jgi:hypothetical protein